MTHQADYHDRKLIKQTILYDDNLVPAFICFLINKFSTSFIISKRKRFLRKKERYLLKLNKVGKRNIFASYDIHLPKLLYCCCLLGYLLVCVIADVERLNREVISFMMLAFECFAAHFVRVFLDNQLT